MDTDEIYKDIAEDVKNRFDTSNYELDRPFPKWKNQKVIGLIKDKLGGVIITKNFWIKSENLLLLNRWPQRR